MQYPRFQLPLMRWLWVATAIGKPRYPRAWGVVGIRWPFWLPGYNQCDMVISMTALISWVFRLVHGDLYATAKHRLTSAVTVPTAGVYLGTRQGWRYRRPSYRWMSPTLLMRKVRERDAHTATRPMRWWEQDNDTPDLKQVVIGALGDAGTWVWNAEGTVGRFTWSNVLKDDGTLA